MKLRRLFRARALSMLGDCDDCGHSVIYHLPVVGCTKCDCEEFH